MVRLRLAACLVIGSLGCGDNLPADKSLDDFLPELPDPTGDDQMAFAGQIDSADELLPGPAASGLVGDFFIRNSRTRFVVQAPGRVIGVVPPGGNVIDAATANGSDHFGELSMIYLLGRTCDHQRVDVVLDGSGGGAAAIVARGVSVRNDFINLRGMGILPVPADLDPDIPDEVECATTYLLEPDSDTLSVRWTLYNPGEEDIVGPFASFSDTGGVVSQWTTAKGFAAAGFDDLQGSIGPSPSDYAVYQGGAVAYGVIPRHADLTTRNSAFLIAGVSVVLFRGEELLDVLDDETFYLDLPAGGGVTHSVDFVVGRDAGSVTEVFHRGQGTETFPVSGTVGFAGGAPASARIGLYSDDDGDGQVSGGDGIVTYLDSDAAGAFAGSIAPGNYLARAEVPDIGRSESVLVSVTDSAQTVPMLTIPDPISVDYTIVDADTGNTIPGRISVIGRHPVSPDQAVFPVADRTNNLVTMVHSVLGTTTDVGDGAEPTLRLPAGAAYRLVASRGTEWSIASEVLDFTSGGTAQNLVFELLQVAPATDYVASEYHVHSIDSPDSIISQETRVATAIAEGLELYTSTDHDYVSNHQPVIESMGVTSLVRNLTGIEATPFAFGHFNAWPIEPDDTSPNAGAVNWSQGVIGGFAMIPEEIFDALRARGAELVQVNHPRSRGGPSDFQQYFDRAALAFDYATRGIGGDSTSQPVPNEWLRLPPEASMWSDEFNALEVWNGFSTADTDDDGVRELTRLDVVMRDWFNFLSFGLTLTPTGSSDTHKAVSDPMGMPRTYVRVADDSASALASGGVVADVLARLTGRDPIDIVVTNGPHISVSVGAEDEPVGRIIDGTGGPLDVTITVTSPAWAHIDTIELFANSTPEIGAGVTALLPTYCFTTRDTGSLADTDPCRLAPAGGARAMTVNSVEVSPGFSRFEAQISFQIGASDVVNREGASGTDAWFVVRTRGQRGIFPLLLDGVLGDGSIDVMVSGTPAEITAELDGRGVPATAFTAPFYVDFDGGGYRAPFGPQ